MSFWDVFWLILVSFALLAQLMVMFVIVTDLFRDQEASGWAKGAWIVALILFPLLSSVAYLVVNGRDMAARQVRSVEQVRDQQEAYIRQVAHRASPAEQIAQAKQLLDAGAITPAEYERLKDKVLT